MEINSKIYIAGHRGLVGSVILRKLKELGYSNIVINDGRITKWISGEIKKLW